MRILVPLDTSSLSQTALSYATEIAAGTGRGLLLATVADAETRLSISEFARAEGEEPTDMLESNLRSVAGSVDGLDVATDLLRGDDPSSAIVDRADREDVNMIVMATHGRTGLARWRIGSVAERVVRGASVPVLVVPAPWRQAQPPAPDPTRGT